MTRKYFGTDGIRGTVGTAPITPDFMLKLGWAAGKVLGGDAGGKVLIGKDTRISGYMFESALEAGLSAAGVDTLLLGPLPTPAVSYLTRTFSAQAGIVISASHNPFADNGIKFFGPDGRKLSDHLESEIERLIDQPLVCVHPAGLGRAKRINDAAGRYVEFCKSTFGGDTSLKGLRIVVDCAHGAAYQVGPAVFRELGAEVITIGNEPDGLNINKDVGSTYPAALQTAVKARGADLGVALDGDADRVVMVDHEGRLVDGDQLLFVIADHLTAQGRFEGGVVGTLMTNLGLEQAFAARGIPFARANVGDRYVVAEMVKRGWMLGGETSGHVVCGHATGTGDGLVTALQVVAAVRGSGKTLAALSRGYESCPQVLVNVRIAEKVNLAEQASIQAAVVSAESAMGGDGRVLLRASGTEPLIRVMVEAQSQTVADTHAHTIADVVRASLSD
ncbi:phosphoglucosamine mutase [Litorivicinus lipolyticus]|uniref:phosphoglucosamine mutase n=1 Tax=Litorivicinus lipolyticus TaxID=418701 RepID=UPI003B5C81AC